MRRVLITGGASGLGLALAEQLLARGDRVVVGDLADERPAAVPAAADYLRLDVRSQTDWDAALSHIRSTGGLDVLVNNAGVATGGRIDVESIADWQRVIDVNLLGVVRGCQTFTPLFKDQHRGHIVNIASLAGLVHGPGMSSYNAAKAGVVALSETLGFELAPWGITVSVVCPAFFKTNLHTSLQGKDSSLEETATKLITRARVGADEIAAKVIAGMDAGKPVILTDRLGHTSFWVKRLARPVYTRAGRRAAYGMARKRSGNG